MSYTFVLPNVWTVKPIGVMRTRVLVHQGDSQHGYLAMWFSSSAIQITLELMALFDAIPTAVAELVGYVVSKVTGRVFKLNPKESQRLGEYVVLGLIAFGGLIITLVYS